MDFALACCLYSRMMAYTQNMAFDRAVVISTMAVYTWCECINSCILIKLENEYIYRQSIYLPSGLIYTSSISNNHSLKFVCTLPYSSMVIC